MAEIVNSTAGQSTAGVKPIFGRWSGADVLQAHELRKRFDPFGRHEEGAEALVVVVDDDPRIRAGILALFQSVGIDAIEFGSAVEVLQADLPDRPICFIMDVRMPGLSGLDFQQYMLANQIERPIVFLTGHGDIAMSVQAMKSGAIDFLTKPVRDQILLDAVAIGIEQDRRRRTSARRAEKHCAMIATLTRRERQVLRAVALGRLNKQIAYDLGISEITVKLHRGNVMRKLKATSVGDLVRLWEMLPAHLRQCEAPAQLALVG